MGTRFIEEVIETIELIISILNSKTLFEDLIEY